LAAAAEETLFVDVAGARLECLRIGGGDSQPSLVFLHEGLGSVALWRDFPRQVASATGLGVLVYSRPGYGRSTPAPLPRQPRYMHDEAMVTLPALLDKLGIARPVLVGHSDGASIALIHAGAEVRPVAGLVALAPHVFVEDVSIASIERAKHAYASTDLREKLSRYHADADSAFLGWNDIWLSSEFRQWNIEPCLPRIHCPVLLIQGRDDEYGTLAQLDAIERQIPAPVHRVVLGDCGHSPHRDQPQATVAAITAFASRFLSETGRAHS
jgi:pimeloyl-ACP methyl ester carboxylesterase